MDALRKKGAAVQRSLETRRIQRALSPFGSGVAPDAPNLTEPDAFLPFEELPTSPVGDQPEHGEGGDGVGGDGEGGDGGEEMVWEEVVREHPGLFRGKVFLFGGLPRREVFVCL